MTWGTDLWDQYDSVGKHTEKGIDFLDKYSHFLKKRCEIELGYASELKKLVKSYQPKKKDEEDNQFSWAKNFHFMLKELHDLAGQHEVIAENTQAQLVQDIQKFIIELKNDRKKFLQEGVKNQTQLKDIIKSHDNAKRNYERKFSEAERALEVYKRSDANIDLSRAEVEKTRLLSNKKSQEAEESKNEYASQLQNTNKFQRDYYTAHMPQVFQQLQDLDERRINKIKSVITQSASIEKSVLPIISTCIDGMTKCANDINIDTDSKLVIDRYRTGFPIPDDIPFEDLSNSRLNNGNNVIKTSTPVTVSGKSGTIGGKGKKRSGILGLFNKSNTDDQREDFAHIPPAQRKAKLNKKMDEIRKQIAHETAEREGMTKMKEVYANNPALGDPNSLDKKIQQNAEKLNQLQAELRKNQDYLTDAEGDMNMKRRGSDDSMTQSITSEGSINAPGTPQQPHSSPEEYYDRRSYRPVEEQPHIIEPEPIEPETDEFNCTVIGTCRALYPFEAQNNGSISMAENEEMYVLESDQGDGWTHVRKEEDNSEGFVPTSYIQCHFYDQDAV